jgi:glutathione S-transferase
MLQETGAPFSIQLLDLGKGEQRTPDFLSINPRGQVPVLRDGDVTLTEGVAIIDYIASKHPQQASAMLPVAQPQRGRVMQALLHVNANMHPVFSQIFGAGKVYSDPAQQNAVKAAAYAKLEKMYADLDALLSRQAFMAGDHISIADVMMAVVSGWRNNAGLPFEYGPNVKRVIAAVEARPSFKAVLEREAAAKATKEKAAA